MARPRKCRRICSEPDFDRFVPDGASAGDIVILSVDEFETIRLIDFEKKTHEQCAAQMEVARTTVTEMYETARGKIAECLVNGKTLQITGGNYRLCNGSAHQCCGKVCHMDTERHTPQIKQKGASHMRIAVTYDNGMVFQHFGHTENFKIYDVEDNKVISSQVIPTMGQGHGALAGFLSGHRIDVLICGGIGGGAQMALSEAGIRLYGGVSGEADNAVDAFLAGTLGYDPNVHCDHHDHEHGEGDHNCGAHGCGNH